MLDSPELHALYNHVRYAYDALGRALAVFEELDQLTQAVERARRELRQARLRRAALAPTPALARPEVKRR